MITMKCPKCGFELTPVKTEIKGGWGKYQLTISGVDAFTCTKCGESIISYDDAKAIQDISKAFSEMQQAPDVLNVNETADLLRVSKQSIYNMLKDGRLKAIKFGREWRFLRKDILSILNADDSLLAAREGDSQLNKNDKQLLDSLIDEEKDE